MKLKYVTYINVFNFSRPVNFYWKYDPSVKATVKFALQQATKAQRWSRGIALLFP
jgi:hypothetical protein